MFARRRRDIPFHENQILSPRKGFSDRFMILIVISGWRYVASVATQAERDFDSVDVCLVGRSLSEKEKQRNKADVQKKVVCQLSV